MINPRAKQLWLDALRSNTYTQGEGALHTIDDTGQERLCCLGVLCQVAMKEGVVLRRTARLDSGGRTIVEYNNLDGVLPDPVLQWSGLDNRNPSFRPGHDVAMGFIVRNPDFPTASVGVSLAECNDNGYTFTEVADIIEKYLPTVDELCSGASTSKKPRLRIQRSVTEEDFDE